MHQVYLPAVPTFVLSTPFAVFRNIYLCFFSLSLRSPPPLPLQARPEPEQHRNRRRTLRPPRAAHAKPCQELPEGCRRGIPADGMPFADKPRCHLQPPGRTKNPRCEISSFSHTCRMGLSMAVMTQSTMVFPYRFSRHFFSRHNIYVPTCESHVRVKPHPTIKKSRCIVNIDSPGGGGRVARKRLNYA